MRTRKPPAVPFPPGFLWGAATAAHQVEGGLDNDWARFEAQPGAVRNGHTSRDGVDHYNRYEEDFSLAAGMGHNVHRLSIEWSRIEPERGHWNRDEIAHYLDVLHAMRKQGLEPMVTLHHFTNPHWVADQGGWENEETARDFARFAAFAAACFGDKVRYWLTVNEPNGYAFMGYMNAVWPPLKRDFPLAFKVLGNFARGHILAYHAIHEAVRAHTGHWNDVQVGLANHFLLFDPGRTWHPLDRAVAYYADRVCNRAFLGAVTTGKIEFGVPGVGFFRANMRLGHGALDFIGLNYYQRGFVYGFKPPVPAVGAPTNGMGWEIYPKGLYRSLKIADEYTRLPDGRRIPIYITENGVDDRTGNDRSSFLVQHLQYLAAAMHEGVDVRGYLHWTLMDNFEWAHGYEPRFGLYRIDRDRDFARVPTGAVEVYREIAQANGLTAALLDAFGTPLRWRTPGQDVAAAA